MQIDWSLAMDLYEVGLKPSYLFSSPHEVQVLWDYLQPATRIRPPAQVKPLKKVDMVVEAVSEVEQLAIRIRDLCREGQEHFINEQLYRGIAAIEVMVEKKRNYYRNRAGFVVLFQLAKVKNWGVQEEFLFGRAIEEWSEGGQLGFPWIEQVYMLPRIKRPFYRPSAIDPETVVPDYLIQLISWRMQQTRSLRYLVRKVAAYQYLDLLRFLKEERDRN